MNPVRIIYTPIPSGGFSSPWCEDAVSILDTHELTRLKNYKHSALQQRFLLARKLIKTEVSRRLHCKPKDVRLTYSDNGKPFVRAHPELAISITHCESWVAVAIANENMGIDIECTARQGAPWTNAARLLNPDIERLLTLASALGTTRPALFGALWCCMESQVKVKDTSVFTERRLLLPSRLEKGALFSIEGLNNQPYSAAAYSVGKALLAVAVMGQHTAEEMVNKVVLEENLASSDYDSERQNRSHPIPLLALSGCSTG